MYTIFNIYWINSVKPVITALVLIAVILAIFFVDTFCSINISIPVFYIVVIIFYSNKESLQRVYGLSAACMLLTVLAFLLGHYNNIWSIEFAHCFVNLVAIISTTFLIRKNKLKSEKLRYSEELLTQTQELSKTGSIRFDSPTKQVTWSHETARIFDYDLTKQPTLACIYRRVHRADIVNLKEALTEFSDESSLVSVQFRLMLSNHKIKYVCMLLKRVPLGDTSAVYIGAIQDITKFKLNEFAKTKAQSDLAHANRVSVLGELTTTLAHDINQPLSAITINSEAAGRWLAQSPINTHEIKQNLLGINKGAQKASDIIQCIYALAKKSPIDKTLVPINSIFSESFALMDGLINKTDVAIDYQGNSADCALFANKVALQQVIINLLLNSIQAFKHDQADKKISITVQINGPNIEIIMKDNGPGFKSDSASKFFNAFYTTKKNGMGMGLTICSTIIKDHNGIIKISNNPTGGACVILSLKAQCDGGEVYE